MSRERLPIVQYWHSGGPPGHIAELIGSFGELNPGLRHLVFDERSATAFIAERFGSRHREAFRACAVPAMQADYFRYCAVFALGGVYCDADFRCVASLRPLVPPPGAGRLCRARHGQIINGVFAFGSPGHAFLELATELATVNIEHRRWESVYFTTGPPIFSSMFKLHLLGSFDAFLEHHADSVIVDYLREYCEVIGDYSRLSDAVEGIETLAPMEHCAFVRPQGSTPRGEAEPHWTSAGQIFRVRADRGFS